MVERFRTAEDKSKQKSKSRCLTTLACAILIYFCIVKYVNYEPGYRNSVNE